MRCLTHYELVKTITVTTHEDQRGTRWCHAEIPCLFFLKKFLFFSCAEAKHIYLFFWSQKIISTKFIHSKYVPLTIEKLYLSYHYIYKLTYIHVQKTSDILVWATLHEFMFLLHNLTGIT